MWDFTDPHNKIQDIIYSVLVNAAYVRMIIRESGGVREHPNIPQSYKRRVKIEGRATLVRMLTLEIILNLNVNSQEAFLDQLYAQFSLL